MTETDIKLTIGGLLHDLGKIVYRKGDDRRNHSRAGYDYLKDNDLLNDKQILDIILYHHAADIKAADLEPDSLAYIVYMADNIAAVIDRRDKDKNSSCRYGLFSLGQLQGP